MRNCALYLLVLTLFSCSFNMKSSRTTSSIEDVVELKKTGDDTWEALCENGETSEVTSEDILSNNICGASSNPNFIELYHDDGRCDSNKFIAFIGRDTDCKSLAGLERVWGIKLNGNCKDIPDKDAVNVCTDYKRRLPPAGPHVELYHDDGKCNPDKLIGFVGEETDCKSLAGLERVWGIKLNDACQDIPDKDAVNICTDYKRRLPPRGPHVELYHDDGRCDSNKLIGFVGEDTDCKSLAGLERVWGIKLNGNCKDIPDKDAINVCTDYKRRLPPSGPHVELYHDDGKCNPDKLIGFVGEGTDCKSLAGVERVWGVKINGACKDISDKDAVNVCTDYKRRLPPRGPHVELYHDDGKCNSEKLIGFVGRETDCKSLVGLEKVWGIKFNGACKDISDKDAVNVCTDYKRRLR